jgi:hypothetical protein
MKSSGAECSLSVRPILQMPFVYNIPDSAYKDGKGAYDVSLIRYSVSSWA